MTPNHNFPPVFSSTTIAALTSCQEKFNRAHVQDLKPAGTSIHLVFGGCFARGTEVTRKAFFADHLDEDLAIARGLIAIGIEWLKHGLDPAADAFPGKTFPNLLSAFVGYFENFGLAGDRLTPHVVGGKPVVEFSFALPVPNCFHPVTGDQILYGGRFDMVAEDNGVLWNVDEKTTSQLGPTWAEKWEMRSQFTGYCWGAQQFGLPVVGTIVRGVCVTKAGNLSYMPAITYRQDWRIDRWLHSLELKIKMAISAFERDEYIFAEDDACYAYSACPYLRLCSVKDPEPFIEPYFKVEKWDPLHRAGD